MFVQYYWTCSNKKGSRGRISAQPSVSSGGGDDRESQAWAVHGVRSWRNKRKFCKVRASVSLRRWTDVRGMIFHCRIWEWGEVGMSYGCLKVQNNHTTWNTICNNYKLHSFVLINLMFTMPTFKMGQLRYVGLHDLLVRRQSCPTLCDPMDYSLPGPFVHGIL